MARTLPHDLLKAIRATVHAAAGGMSLSEVHAGFPAVPRRTLQRHLALLVGAGALVALGGGRSRRYLAPPSRKPVFVPAPPMGVREPTPGDGELPLGQAAEDIRLLVRSPIAMRQPVGYRREFLDAYRPNEDCYLPPRMRERLHQLGRSSAAERPAGTYARQIMDRLLIDLSWSSSRLEGNTYSRLDTQNLIEFGRLAEGKDRLHAQMILNHKAAIEMLVEEAGEIAFNRYTLQNLHALLAQNLMPDAGAEGRIRRIDVAISGTVYLPTAIPQVIEEYFDRFLQKAAAIHDPFEQSFFAMVHLPYLQPFEDVNKRTSRLAANIPLIRDNLAPLSFIDTPEGAYIDGILGVYELNRVELLRDVYAWSYERSCRRYTLLRETLPEPDPFRLRHRQAMIDVIGEVVARGVARGDAAGVRAVARPHVAAGELEEFVALVLRELHHLHEGNIARYALRPAQFRPWLAAQAAAAPG